MTRKCDDLILVSSDSDSSFTEVGKGDAIVHNLLTFNRDLISPRYPFSSRASLLLASDEFSPRHFDSYDLGLNNKNCAFKQPEPPDFDKINSLRNKKSNKGKCGRFKNREKEKMNEEKQREKLRKKKASDVVTKMKPGICMNYISVIVDNNLINCKFGGVILSAIVECGSSHIVKSQCIPYSITWNRKIVDENGSTITEEENFALIVWDAEHFLTKVEIDNVQDSIRLAQNNLPGKSLTLAIYNLEKYLKKDEENKIKNSITKEQSKKKKNRRSQNFHITRLQVEELFIELQLLNECSTWILNTVEDVGNLISQFTKAVAEKPYKTEKQMQQVEGLGWLATCDLKGVVRVDKSGNGLLKLWQQQLMQFNNSGLDVAQAITEQYPTPLALYKAYCLCNNSKEGEELLKDIRIRRGFGEVATTRRIGPELSKKIYYFFNSHDANLPLSQD